MEIKKSYLKIEEIAEIVDKMLESDFSYNREVIKVSLVAKCCIDFDFKDKNVLRIFNIKLKIWSYDSVFVKISFNLFSIHFKNSLFLFLYTSKFLISLVKKSEKTSKYVKGILKNSE